MYKRGERVTEEHWRIIVGQNIQGFSMDHIVECEKQPIREMRLCVNLSWFPRLDRLNLSFYMCELLKPFFQSKWRWRRKTETILNLIHFPHFSLYIYCIPVIFPVKEFPSDSADASLDIQGKVWKEFLWNWKWTSFDQLGQTLVISQREFANLSQ